MCDEMQLKSPGERLGVIAEAVCVVGSGDVDSMRGALMFPL